MMSRQLLLLIASATVSWINAVERCIDCTLMPTKEESDITKPGSCSTDCLIQEENKPELFTPWSKLGPVLQFDDAGIYYEPAEMLPFDQVSVIPQPFYILNPAYQVDARVSRSAKRLDEGISNPLSSDIHFPKSRHNKVDKHRKKSENVHKKSERQHKKLPFYLDVDLPPAKETRDATSVDSHIINFKLAEQYLSVCLDLHVLEYYRKNDSTFKNLKDVWSNTKFHYYDTWSDLDLENEIIKKCNHSMDILKRSLDEIKETWPKNNVLSFNSSQTDPSNARSGYINNQTFHIHSDGIISKPSLEQILFTPINYTFTEQTTSATNIVKENVFRNANNNNTGTQFHFTLLSPVDQINFDAMASSTVGNDDLTDTTYMTTVAQHPEVQETSSKSVLYAEDSFHSNSPYGPGHKKIEREGNLSSYTNTSFTNSKIFFIPMLQGTLNIFPKNVSTDVTTSDDKESIVIEPETASGIGNNDGSFTTTPYAGNGKTFSKLSIEVSEIIAKEYPNETAIAEKFKPALLKHNSVFDLKDTTSVSVTSNISRPTTTASTEETTDNNATMNSGNHSSEEHINGNLYFLYRNHSVPVRFIQHPDGKIDVGLDGYSVCDSVNDLAVNFVLLNVLCNCVKFNNCTNSS